MKILLISLSLLTLFTSGRPSPQNSLELTGLGENVVNFIQSKKPEWKYETVSPIQDSTDVVLQQWSFEGQSVRVAIVSHRTVTEAAGEIQNLASRRGQRAVFNELGDEDVTWGRGTVSFRKHNLTVNVTAVITSPTVDAAEAAKHEPDERKLAKEFAQLVAKAIKDKK